MKLTLDLKNCYGIKTLCHEFDFSTGNAFLIYASNGAMKTSLAKVFKDISQGTVPKDTIFTDRPTTCSVTNEHGACPNPAHILVVYPYEEDFDSPQISTLLVNETLKKQYQSIHDSINKARSNLFSSAMKLAGIRKDADQEIAATFNIKIGDIYSLLDTIESKVKANHDNLSFVSYRDVFNDKVQAFLASGNIPNLLSEYLTKYNELIDQSEYFRKGVFTHNNASTISRSLKENGFFAAKHSISLADSRSTKKEISSDKELDSAISQEKDRILKNPDLLKKFEDFDKQITRNAELKALRTHLEDHPELLPELANLATLKQKVWISYIAANMDLYDIFLQVYRQGKVELTRITNSARNEITLWHEVVAIFNQRFSVPFRLEVANQADVILKDESPSLIFNYEDGTEHRAVGKDQLLNALSTGEKRALYMLNVIFEVQARLKKNEDTIMVLDDIADSFDYKNKYAIIQYLKDISLSGKYFMLILTHNFDFFRTVQSRMVRRDNCLMAVKTTSEVKLEQAQYLKPFETWKATMSTNNRALIALIPMVRNLIEYSLGDTSHEYVKLTSLLHQKPGSDSITLEEIAIIFNSTLASTITLAPIPAIPLILAEADACLKVPESINLENKVVLSIAIRLIAERAMLIKINNPGLTDAITSNQTARLFEAFKSSFPSDVDGIKLLDQVVMMTPEAIHLNSFMYEPIIDLSDFHLKELYKKIKVFAGLPNNP